MGLLNWLFGRSRPDRIVFFESMREMVSEGERIYRGMTEVYNEEFASEMPRDPSESSATPTGLGVYKARLYGAFFMVAAFGRSEASDSDFQEFINVGASAAVNPLLKGGPLRLTVEEAQALNKTFLWPMLLGRVD